MTATLHKLLAELGPAQPRLRALLQLMSSVRKQAALAVAAEAAHPLVADLGLPHRLLSPYGFTTMTCKRG